MTPTFSVFPPPVLNAWEQIAPHIALSTDPGSIRLQLGNAATLITVDAQRTAEQIKALLKSSVHRLEKRNDFCGDTQMLISVAVTNGSGRLIQFIWDATMSKWHS